VNKFNVFKTDRHNNLPTTEHETLQLSSQQTTVTVWYGSWTKATECEAVTKLDSQVRNAVTARFDVSSNLGVVWFTTSSVTQTPTWNEWMQKHGQTFELPVREFNTATLYLDKFNLVDH